MNRHLRRWVVGLILVGAAMAARAQTPGSDMLQRIVLTENDAYGMLPAELIAAPVVTNLSFSSDGRYMLVQRMSVKVTQQMVQALIGSPGPRREPPGEASLVFWDSRTRVAREVWKAATPETMVQQTSWLPGSDVALVLVMQQLPPDPRHPEEGPQMRQGLLRISPALDKAQVVGLTELGDITGALVLEVSPTRPMAILQHNQVVSHEEPQPDGTTKRTYDVHETLYVLGESGRPGAHVEIPKDAPVAQIQWDDAGPVIQLMHRTPDQKGVTPKWYAMDLRSAELRPLEKAPAFATPRPAVPLPAAGLPIRVKKTVIAAKEDQTSQNVGLLWLESIAKSERPRALVCGDCVNGDILQRGEAIVYQSQGAVWAVPLIKVTREAYTAAVALAQRMVLFNNAKQLGLGILMYAQDFDEVLPTGDDINSKISPYLQNTDLFNGFFYTYGGGKIADITSPAETELGYVQGPGGRAVIYADGHVKWKGD